MQSSRVVYRVVQGRLGSGSFAAGIDDAHRQLVARWIRCGIRLLSVRVRALLALDNAHQKDMIEALHWARDDSAANYYHYHPADRVVLLDPVTSHSPIRPRPPMWGRGRKPSSQRESESLEAKTCFIRDVFVLARHEGRGPALVLQQGRIFPLEPVFSVALYRGVTEPSCGALDSAGVMCARPGFYNTKSIAFGNESGTMAVPGLGISPHIFAVSFAHTVYYFMHICMQGHPVSHWVRHNTGLVISDLEGAVALLGKENSPSIFRPYCDNSLITRAFYARIVHPDTHLCRFPFLFNHLQAIGLRVNPPKTPRRAYNYE